MLIYAYLVKVHSGSISQGIFLNHMYMCEVSVLVVKVCIFSSSPDDRNMEKQSSKRKVRHIIEFIFVIFITIN